MQWKSFAHNGVAFPEEYKPKGMSVKIRGTPVLLSPIAEEMAVAVAKKQGTKYLDDPVFTKNFMLDFGPTLPKEFNGVDFKDVDFTEVVNAVNSEKLHKAAERAENPQIAAEAKAVKAALQDRYGSVFIDGTKYQVANWMVESSGLFFGRGLSPNRGRWKPRLGEQDITLNLSPDAPVPPGNWAGIVHEPGGFWIAKWCDRVSGKVKYVLPHESTPIRIQRNKKKYLKAKKLAANIAKVRTTIKAAMESPDIKKRQSATISYLIDTYGFRVGNEKDEDEAQTIGASTLKVSNIRIDGTSLTFDFIGKDSVKFEHTYQNVEPLLLKNLGDFIKGKGPDDLVFETSSSEAVNAFLAKTMPGLTAKVFRTYKGTLAVKTYLDTHDPGKEAYEKKYVAKMANLEAAKALNHKRTLPPKWEEQLKVKEESLKRLQALGEKKPKQLKKAELDLDLQVQTRDYNLNTSLKNYIDPTVYKAWCAKVGLDWAKIYSKTLQKKFSWVERLKNPQSEGVADEPKAEDGAVQAAR
jgi:DNA topoisomerase-1